MAQLVNLGSIFGDKPWYQSLTAWGLVAYVAGEAIISEACGAQALFGSALCATLSSSIQTIGVVLTALGLRRASVKA
jgi:hypothetical protein